MINPCPSHDLYSEMNFSDLLIPFRLTLHNNQRALISQSLLQPLVDVASSSPCLRTRAASIEAILLIDPSQRDRLYSSFGSSNDQLVRAALLPDSAET